MTEQPSQLEEEVESWNGFSWVLRKEDRELWDAMIKGIRLDFGEAVEKSGKTFTTDPFFMALLLAQQRMIKRLEYELRGHGVETADSVAAQTALDLGREPEF